MKIFIASPWKNKAAVAALSKTLEARGAQVYSFLQSGANLPTGLSIVEELRMFSDVMANWPRSDEVRQIFQSEMAAIRDSDMLVLLQPVGHSSLIEAGIAYGLGKRVVSVGGIEKPDVFYLICEAFYQNADEFLASLNQAPPQG